MTAMVLDCSVVCAWLLEDERVPEADTLLAEVVRKGAVAPGLWWAELRNVLIMAERRGRITEPGTAAALASVEALSIELDHTPRGEDTLRLARQHRVSVYDALYLELALRKQASLATLDRRLSRAATSEGVAIA